MSTIKRYKITQVWGDIEVTVEVDHSILTPELATEINSFWSGAKYRISSSGGDVVMAVVKRISAQLMRALLELDSIPHAQNVLDTSEGYPPNGAHGVKLIDFDGLPEIESDDLIVEDA